MSNDQLLITPKMKLQNLLDSLLQSNESKIRNYKTPAYATQTSFKKGNSSRLVTSISPVKKPTSQRARSRQNIERIAPATSQTLRKFVVSSRASNADIPPEISIQLDDNASLFTDTAIERPKKLNICKDCLKKISMISALESSNAWLKQEILRLQMTSQRTRERSTTAAKDNYLQEQVKILNMQRDMNEKQHKQDIFKLKAQHSIELEASKALQMDMMQKIESLSSDIHKFERVVEEMNSLEKCIKSLQKESTEKQLRIQEQNNQIDFLAQLDGQLRDRQTILSQQLNEFFVDLLIVIKIFRGEQPIQEILRQRKQITVQSNETVIDPLKNIINNTGARLGFLVELQIRINESHKILKEIEREYKSKYLQNLIY